MPLSHDDSAMMQSMLADRSYYLANAPWLPWIAAVWFVFAVLTILAYRRSSLPLLGRTLAIGLRLAGIGLLLACLLEPMASIDIAKPQSNSFAILLDKSQSVEVHWKATLTPGMIGSRDSGFPDNLKNASSWSTRLSDVFRLQRYVVGESLEPVDSFEAVAFDSKESALVGALQSIRDRIPPLRKLDRAPVTDRAPAAKDPSVLAPPLAGVLLLSDGQATDANTIERLNDFPVPIYPVTLGSKRHSRDLAIESVVTQQSDFETAPVTLVCNLIQNGLDGSEVRVDLKGGDGELLEQKKVQMRPGGQTTRVEFRFRPRELGVQGYSLHAHVDPSHGIGTAAETGSGNGSEATLLNNHRYLVIDRGRGPHPVLYISGRPNWEYKFLSRALNEDREIELHGLIRIARKEAKFSFRDNVSGDANSLFSGFEDMSEEEKEQYDEPVFVRLGNRENGSSSKGFPDSLKELFEYKGIILDDLDGDLLTQEQQWMLSQFVRTRGGGMLFLGGAESMRGAEFNSSPIGQLAPVYSERTEDDQPGDEIRFIPPDSEPAHESFTLDPNREAMQVVRLELTRDGWLQPFMRLADSEAKEKERLQSAPSIQVWNRVAGVKPGATVLAQGRLEPESSDDSEDAVPLLIAQRFGRGRTAALLLGDWWRWAMSHEGNGASPAYQAWRQLVRWSLTDVPEFHQFTSRPQEEFPRARTLLIDLRTHLFEPIEGASIEIIVTKPNGETQKLMADAHSVPTGPHPTSGPYPSAGSYQAGGSYQATVLCDLDGVYKATAICKLPESQGAVELVTGWTYEPLNEEFRGIGENTALLEQIAKKSGGRLVGWDELNSFSAQVPHGDVPVKETVVYPVWHQAWVLSLAIGCLCLEWGWRRRNGMA